jgi:ABC-2 type transport system ATP-binding protein
MTAILQARGLGKRYRRRWALTHCDLDIPAGRVTGLVGPNGAGKTTLLSLAAGLRHPTTGEIVVCGGPPGRDRAQLGQVSFVAQDTPVYGRLTVADHLRLGARLSPRWDAGLAASRIRRLGLPPGQRAGRLSGGQRAQLSLTLAVARRPRLLILDEPVASLDPLARASFLAELTQTAAAQELSVLHSTHLVADLEQVCDYLIILVASRVRMAGDVATLLAGHRLLTGPPGSARPAGRSAADGPAVPGGRAALAGRPEVPPEAVLEGRPGLGDRAVPVGSAGPPGLRIISARQAGGRAVLVAEAGGPPPGPGWTASPVTLTDLVLAFLAWAEAAGAPGDGAGQAAQSGQPGGTAPAGVRA